MSSTSMSRREAIKLTGAATMGAIIAPNLLAADDAPEPDGSRGYVIGQPLAQKVGMQVLADGGNAIDAIVASALTAAVVDPLNTGVGGYGMSAILAVDGGKRIVSIDGNSTAPAALTPDHFKPGPDGKVSKDVTDFGWLSAGVPGVMAGLGLTLEKFGTRSFAELVQPAIAYARNGFPWQAGPAACVKNNHWFSKDEGSRKLYFPGGQPVAVGAPFKNPDLAEVLETLAKANSVEPFYRGDIAQRIAEGFAKNGGLVTAQDMAEFRARVTQPLALQWGAHTIHTAPLTAGGLSILQMLHAMKAMDWEKLPEGLPRLHARIEAARLAWNDRLTLLGDPDVVDVPVKRLLSADYARESAERILAAVKAGKMIEHPVTPNPQTGTVNLSAADTKGNFIALTLTHGGAFGSCVTVDGLGLTLGHSVSRFEFGKPGHPNAPGPRKKPLHNMCPTMVTKNGKAVLAAGGAGGRMIPNALLEVLTEFVVLGKPVAEVIAAPRFHTEGNTSLGFEKEWPAADFEPLKKIGYAVKTQASASIGAVALEGGALKRARR